MNLLALTAAILMFLSCGEKDDSRNDSSSNDNSPSRSGQWVQAVSFDGVEVNVIIDKPKTDNTDVIMLFHGTAGTDSKILDASQLILDNTKMMLSDREVTFVSVVYPEENLLFGDNIKFGEAAVKWVKDNMPKELGMSMNKLFMLGHSQGGHMVTKLGRIFEVDGIIANAPGPLNLADRCRKELSGQIEKSVPCEKLKETYGSVIDDPSQYMDRSLLSKIDGFKSRILFTQGLKDADIQIEFWPVLKNKVEACTDCKSFEFVEFENGAHPALFTEKNGANILKEFLDK